MASGAFVAAGLLLLSEGEVRVGVGTIVFFGCCFGVFAWQIVAARRSARALATRGRVEGIGGVRLVARRGRAFAGAAVCLVVGVTFAWQFAPQGWWPAAVGWVIAALGVGLGAALLRQGRVGGQWLALTPLGLERGLPRARYLVPWDDIAAVELGELYGNTAVLVALRRVDRTIASVEPAGARGWAATELGNSVNLLGAHVVILTEVFGIEGVWLARALQQYATEPERRRELAPMAAIADV